VGNSGTATVWSQIKRRYAILVLGSHRAFTPPDGLLGVTVSRDTSGPFSLKNNYCTPRRAFKSILPDIFK
jgi:hypothetical protein